MIIDFQSAVELIKKGDVIAFPTETVYGLGADANNILAIKKTYELKGRPSDNPLIVHVSSVSQAEDITRNLPESFYKLAESFWPGPLTLIVEKNPSVPDIVTGGLSTVAVRMPNHPLALKLITQSGPLTAPSANKSGKPSPTKPEHIWQDYGDVLPVLDGGSTTIGLESTILDLTSELPEILRPGAISNIELSEALGEKIRPFQEKKFNEPKPVKSPGTKYTHYKPDAEVKWIRKIPKSLEIKALYIVHSQKKLPNAKNLISYGGNFKALAKDLYDIFRSADHQQYEKIYIEELPEQQKDTMISALNNRISKACNE
ncbi:L-threonylcarbamoyladenylate synthase [Rhodohalobacter sp.]|uniref:L-threonylcarbamoyladenylate synthase n=1 Tax=Rhodohalobacter sp. TaxID=1974210 RepID=UPI003567FB07